MPPSAGSDVLLGVTSPGCVPSTLHYEPTSLLPPAIPQKAFHQQSSTAYLKEKKHYSEKAPQTRGQEEGWAQLPSPAPPGADPESSREPSAALAACGGAGTSLGAITNKVQKPPGLPPRVELEDGFL